METEVGRVGERREREESEAKKMRAVKAQRTSASRKDPVKKARAKKQQHKMGQPTGRGKKVVEDQPRGGVSRQWTRGSAGRGH